MTDRENLERFVSGFPTTTVLIVGDVMLDAFLWGEVRRISPEAPVPVVEVERESAVPGGAANTAAGVVALSGHAIITGVVGDDFEASQLRSQMSSRGIDPGGLVTDSSRPTTTKRRVVASSQQIVRTDRESSAALSRDLEKSILAYALEHLADTDAVVISDYAKGVVSRPLAHRMIEAAVARSLPVVVDSKSTDYSQYRGATVLTPNAIEAARAASMDPDRDPELDEVAKVLLGLTGDVALLITRGAEGMSLYSSPGAPPVHIPACARNVFDITGAGDTVVAVLALALANRASFVEAARLATLAAGVVVGKVGTSTVSLDELWSSTSEGDP